MAYHRRSILGKPEFHKSDARTHRTPKALRAKSIEGHTVSRKPWECVRVLASLSGRTTPKSSRLARRVFFEKAATIAARQKNFKKT